MTKAELEARVKQLEEQVEDLEQQLAYADEAYTEMEAAWSNEFHKNVASMGSFEDLSFALWKDQMLTPQLEAWLIRYRKERQNGM